MSYDDCIYNNPEKHGLSVVGELNDPQADYNFNDLVVWQHKNGKLYWADDSGCSCPSPFEDYTKIKDLNVLNESDWPHFVVVVKDHAQEWEDSDDEFQCDKNQLLAKVNALLRPPTKREIDDAIAALRRIEESLPQ